MNKEEKEVLKTFKNDLGLTSAEREILLNYIDKLQKEFKDLELAYGLYKDRYETLQKENAELKEEIDNLIEENHKHIDYIANMKKKHEDKIRNKIKELEEETRQLVDEYGDMIENKTIRTLKELLGETKDEE